jgi:etoposide-induced 2.4 mRNA
MKIIFGANSGLLSTVWSWLRPLLSLTFGALWVLPLFLLSRIVNALWFQDIADASYRGRSQSLRSLSKFIADTLFSLVIQALFLIQATLVATLPLPLISQLVSLCFMSLLYSLYSFEYKWFNLGWELPRRLSFIENNWPYFLGFGLPLAVLTSLNDNFIVNGCIFSMLFPLFILSGNEAKPRRTALDVHLPLFQVVVWVSNKIFHSTYFLANSSSTLASNSRGSQRQTAKKVT